VVFCRVKHSKTSKIQIRTMYPGVDDKLTITSMYANNVWPSKTKMGKYAYRLETFETTRFVCVCQSNFLHVNYR